MLHYFNVILLHIALVAVALVIIGIVIVAVFNIVLLQYCPIRCCTVLILHYFMCTDLMFHCLILYASMFTI